MHYYCRPAAREQVKRPTGRQGYTKKQTRKVVNAFEARGSHKGEETLTKRENHLVYDPLQHWRRHFVIPQPALLAHSELVLLALARRRCMRGKDWRWRIDRRIRAQLRGKDRTSGLAYFEATTLLTLL